MKKIVIVGMGVSGSYLANLLDGEYELEVYDGAPRSQIGCKCAWGSSLSLLKWKLEKIGLSIDKYWLCKPDYVVLNGVRFKVANAIIFNKRTMLKDMTEKVEIIPRYVNLPKIIHGDLTLNADLIVNATGTPLTPRQACYTVQWNMELKTPEEKTSYIWFSPQRIGYSWIFPLDEEGKYFHVGAGSLYGAVSATTLTKEILHRYNFSIKKTICGCQKPLHFGRNLLDSYEGKIVSIGEAVGCVHPLTGEGILPSIESAELLAESLREPAFPMNYIYKVEEIISEYGEAYQALETLRAHRRLGMIKVFRVMAKRVKQRAQPQVSFLKKIQTLLKIAL